MKKLLHANFSRLIRSKVFLICAAVMFISSVALTLYSASFVKNFEEDYKFYLDVFVFNLAPYTALLSAVFITLFIGTEYSNKTIRNKLIVGHTRTNIYLADFITCFAGSVFVIALWFVGMIPGVFLTDGFEMGFMGVLEYFFIAVGFTAVFCSIFVLIGTLAPNKALAVVLVMAVWFALMFLGYFADENMTNVNFDKITIIENGKETVVEEVRNRFITYRMLSRINPAAQTIFMATVAYGNLSYSTGDFIFDLGPLYTSSLLDIVFSIVITVIITAIGIFFFRKKELR